jgi:transposase
MKTVSLDVHSETSQLVAVSEDGEILLEMKVSTQAEELRRIIEGIPGPKRVVLEQGPMSGMIHDALADVADEVISCDPTQNAWIARSEDKNDELDARRLAKLSRVGALREVYVPPEPYRTLRSLLVHDLRLMQKITGVKNRIKGMCRRHEIRCHGVSVYREANREDVQKRLPNATLRWQMESLYRELDMLSTERVGAHRVLGRLCRDIPEVGLLTSIPGVGHLIARTLVAWIVTPSRFKSQNALNSYAGLGLGQGVTNWQPIGRARASKRGQRMLKRVIFLAARAAIKGKNGFARRYQARIQDGWEDKKAIRDVARSILSTAAGMWKNGCEYDDELVSVPVSTGS